VKKLMVALLISGLMVFSIASMAFGNSGNPYLSREEIVESLLQADVDWSMYEGTSINFLGNVEPNQEAIGELVPIFEEITGINVTYELVEEELLRHEVTIDLMTRTGVYDAILIDPGYLSLYEKGGGLVDLSIFLDDPNLTDLNWYDWPADFPEQFLAMGQVNGIQFGLPLHLSGTLMMYRKDLYEQKGIAGPAQTMEELWEHAAILHDPANEISGIAMRGMAGAGLNMFIWSTFLKSFGGDWFDDEWRPTLDSEEAIESAQFYADILTEFGPPGVSSWEWSKILSGMQTGRVALTIDTPAFAISIEDPEKSQTVGQWGYAPQPAGRAGIVMGPFAWYVGINSSSDKQEAAWLFLSWMTSKEVQTAIGGPTQYVSRISAIEDPRWLADYPWLEEWQEALLYNAQYADPDARPRIPEYPEIGTITGVALEEVISLISTAEEAFTAVNQEVYQIMEEAGYFD